MKASLKTIAVGVGGREHENFINNANKRAAAVHKHGVGDSVMNELVDCERVGISSGAEKCGCEDVVAVGHLTTTSRMPLAHYTPHLIRTRRPTTTTSSMFIKHKEQTEAGNQCGCTRTVDKAAANSNASWFMPKSCSLAS